MTAQQSATCPARVVVEIPAIAVEATAIRCWIERPPFVRIFLSCSPLLLSTFKTQVSSTCITRLVVVSTNNADLFAEGVEGAEVFIRFM